MDNRKNNRIDSWDEGVYGTGRTEPPKSNSGIVALMMIIIIFLSGIISVLSFMNIQMFHQLQKAQLQQETIPMAFSQTDVEMASAENILQDVYEEEAFSIEFLGLSGEFISPFDQHYFNWPAGMLVTMVDSGSRAESLGLRTGDILIEINGLPITSQQDLTAFLSSDSMEDPCWVTVQRDGAQLTFEEIR